MNKEFVLKIFQTKATRPLSFDGIVKLFPDLTCLLYTSDAADE